MYKIKLCKVLYDDGFHNWKLTCFDLKGRSFQYLKKKNYLATNMLLWFALSFSESQNIT